MQKIRNFSLDQAVRATAGAGKTTGLISAVESCYRSHLSKTGGVLPHILLTTFTIKAANELSERLLAYALKKEDQDFLNYVSSHYLEIGTMHSTFTKVISAVLEEDIEEDLKSFESSKYFYSRKCLHEVVITQGGEDLFELVGDDRELSDVFIKIFESSHLNLRTVSKEEVSTDLINKLQEVISSGDDLYKESVEARFNKISRKSADETLHDLNSFKLWMEEKVSQKCKRDEKSYYRSIVKSLNVPELDLDFLNVFCSTHRKLKLCFDEWKMKYERILESELGFGISDIEWRLHKVLEERGEALDLWDYCFFDEYQDTSPIQKKVINFLTSNTPSYFVGDPYQSIYYFRGARKDIFLNDFKQVEESGGRAEFRLDNYRSSPEVVGCVNTICMEYLDGFKPMQPRKEIDGEVEVFHNEEADFEDELNYLFSKISKVDLGKESFAILGRNAKELMLCARFLKKKGVASSISLSKSFEKSLEIIDLCGVLYFIDYPHDNINLVNLMRSPWFNISDLDIQNFVKQVKGGSYKSVWQAFCAYKDSSLFHDLIEDFKINNYNEAIVNFLYRSEFLNVTDKLDPTGKREFNIWKFIGILQREEDYKGFDVSAFIQDILGGLYPLEKDSSEPESGCVLMTVHASKGLQFDHVAILAANKSFSSRSGSLLINEEDGVFGVRVFSEKEVKKVFLSYFDKTQQQDKNETAQESRRLLYVAMTRAMKNLYISGTGAISKTSFEPSWMKILLDFENASIYKKVDEFDFKESLEKSISDKWEGFLLNRKDVLVHETSSSAVTSLVNEPKDQDMVFENTGHQKSLATYSSNITTGTLFHEFVERSFANGGDKSVVNNFFKVEEEKNHKGYDYLLSQEEFPFKRLIEEGHKEWGFDFINDDGEFSSGKIDLWGRVEDTVWIVDFKTGQDKYREKGFKQLAAYSKVLKRFLKEPQLNFKTVLTFPFIEQTEVREV